MFKVGDKVRANQGAPYGITKDGWVGTVVGIEKDGDIAVQGEDGSCYSVNPEDFTLIPKGISLIALLEGLRKEKTS